MIKYLLTGVYIIFTTFGLFFMKLGGDSLKIVLKPNLSFLLWQKLLVSFDLSYIVPIATGIVQIIVLLIGIFAFKEQVNSLGLIGSILIIVGIILLALIKK